MSVPIQQRELISQYLSWLINQFAEGEKIAIVFQEQKRAGITTYEGSDTYQISFWNQEFRNKEFLQEVVAHEFTHAYFLIKEGDHDHDERFFSYVEFFERWLKNRKQKDN